MPSLTQYRDRLNKINPGLAGRVEKLFDSDNGYAHKLLADLGLTSVEAEEYDTLADEWQLKENKKKDQPEVQKPILRVLDYVWPDPLYTDLDQVKRFVSEFKPVTPYERLVHQFTKDYLALGLKGRELSQTEKSTVAFYKMIDSVFGPVV